MDHKKPSTDEDIFSVKNTGCPYHTQQKLREEHSTDGKPAEMVWSNSLQAWMPLSYRAINKIAKDHKNFLNSEVFGKHSREKIPPDVKLLIAMDGEEHAEKKKQIQRAFKTEEVGRWEPTTRNIVQKQLDYALGKDSSKLDIINDLAIPIPIEVICEVMGIDENNRVATIKDYTDNVVSFLGHSKDDRFTEREKKFDQSDRDKVPIFILKHAYEKRDNLDQKMLSSIVNDEFQIGGVSRKLEDIEIVSDTSLLLFTGNITTTSLMAFCLYHLALNPEVLKEVQSNYKLIDNVISEVMRLEAPAQATYRVAAEDVKIGEIQIKKGDSIYLPWSAAGRDPQKYENPDKFDIHRKEKGHLSLGIGPHRCLGAGLTTMETTVFVEETLDRVKTLSIPKDYKVAFTDMPLFRGFKELMMEYTRK